MSRKTETNHSPCLINSLWQTALNCKFSFLFVMPEALILRKKTQHCFSVRPGKAGGTEGESCYQGCQEWEMEFWAAWNVTSIHIPTEKMPNVPRIIREFRLERTSGGIWPKLLSRQGKLWGQPKVAQGFIQSGLKSPKDGDCTASLGSLHHCFSVPMCFAIYLAWTTRIST